MRGQGRSGPASRLWVHSVPPGRGDREGRCRATDSTTRGDREGPRRWALESRGHGRGAASRWRDAGRAPSPIPVQRQRLEVVKSGSLVCRSSCPSPTQASPQHPSLGLGPLAQGGGRPSSHLSVCPGHLKEACHVGPLVPEAGGGGVEGVGSRGTCPQAGRGRGRWLRTGREDDGKGYDSC